MTSKRLFLKSIKEELRHKVWMVALSLLGNFLAMPVTWLLLYSDVETHRARGIVEGMAAADQEHMIMGWADRGVEYFQTSLLVTAAIIAIIGAVIVGLENFRFLQQKSMVDTFHSLPVSRTALFGTKYVSGLLIWLVPCLLCMTLAWIFAGVSMLRVGGEGAVPGLLLALGKNMVVLLILFLQIYHLMLLATMLTGNVLNTLAVSAILGGGAISFYGMMVGFMDTYFRTYLQRMMLDGGEKGLHAALCCSPLVSPLYLLAASVDVGLPVAGDYRTTLLACLGEALLLGVLAWLAYVRRPSERSGHGVDLVWIAGPMRIFVSLVGGMVGWVFMYSLMGADAVGTAWCIFGALFVGILAYGVLDVVFSMDFKAFFRHRWGMAATAAVTVLVCFGFRGDWVGYDRYLPQQEQIRQASIYSGSYTNAVWMDSLPETMELTDAAQIYAFLERGVENMQGRTHKSEETQLEELYCGSSLSRDAFYVKVVLEDGRSYYRRYYYYEWDGDVVLPLLCSGEYARSCYAITEEMLDNCHGMAFYGGIDKEIMRDVAQQEVLRQVAAGYNQDLQEQPQTVILNQGRVLGRIQMTMGSEEMPRRYYLEVNENMRHTLEAMAQNHIQFPGQALDAEDVESISFEVEGGAYWYRGDHRISPAERSIRGHFGVYPESAPGLEGQPVYETEGSEPQEFRLIITDRAQIEELLPLIQFSNMRGGSGELVQGFAGGVGLTDRQGMQWSVCIRRGALPEEYIRRMLEE